jgi:predicted N-acetyltransferase YhbS
MTCTIDEKASIVYRAVEKHEENEALNLWYSVFGAHHPGCFERDFNAIASPRNQPGDTLGAWYDGRLVSAVHIRRLILHSRDDGNGYLCGNMSNVATLEKYRNQGFSRQLLRLAIERMEQNGEFDVSILGTGQPSHYSVLGWEQISVPATVTIEWKNFDPEMRNIEWRPASEILSSEKELILALHSKTPREYQFDRSPSTQFEQWVGWNWQLYKSIIYVYHQNDSKGYVVIDKSDNVKDIFVSEWRASNIDVEKRLFKIAAEKIRHQQQHQTNIVRFHGLPQHMSIDELKEWGGTVKIESNADTMIRNIRLPQETMDKIKTAYSKGSATFWPGDSF